MTMSANTLVNTIKDRVIYDYNYWADKPNATLDIYYSTILFDMTQFSTIMSAERKKQGMPAFTGSGGRTGILDFDKVMEVRIKAAYESLVSARSANNYVTTQYWTQALEYYLQLRSLIKNNCSSIITRMFDQQEKDNNLSVIYIQGKTIFGFVNLRVRNYEPLPVYQF